MFIEYLIEIQILGKRSYSCIYTYWPNNALKNRLNYGEFVLWIFGRAKVLRENPFQSATNPTCRFIEQLLVNFSVFVLWKAASSEYSQKLPQPITIQVQLFFSVCSAIKCGQWSVMEVIEKMLRCMVFRLDGCSFTMRTQ